MAGNCEISKAKDSSFLDSYLEFRHEIFESAINNVSLPKTIPKEVTSNLEENLNLRFNKLNQEYQNKNFPSITNIEFGKTVSSYYEDFVIATSSGLSIDEVNRKIGFPVYLYFSEEMRKGLLKIQTNQDICKYFGNNKTKEEPDYKKLSNQIYEKKILIESILDKQKTFAEAMNTFGISRYKLLKILKVVDQKYLEAYRSNFNELIKDLEGMNLEKRYQYFKTNINNFISVVENDGISIGEIRNCVAKNTREKEIYKILKKHKGGEWLGKYTYAKNCKYYLHKNK